MRLVRNQAIANGNWEDTAIWDGGVLPDEVMQVVIDSPNTQVNVVGQGDGRVINELIVGGDDAGQSKLSLFSAGASNEGTVTVINHLTLEKNGVIEGDGLITVGGDFTMLEDSLFETSLSGFPVSSMLSFDVAGSAILDGELNVLDTGPTAAVPGDTINLITADGGVTGTFDMVSLPELGFGRRLILVYSANAVSLNVIQIFDGDYNQDGTVDGVDYAIWRESNGQVGANLPADGDGDGDVDLDDYNLWRANFGMSQAAGQVAVPEPSCVVLLGALLSGFATRRRR